MNDLNNLIKLKDGRTFAYAKYGDLHGKPLFFFNGIPGSRFFCPSEEITRKMGVQFITTDRPGTAYRISNPAAVTWTGPRI